jgi:hypothetical protein
MKKSKPQAPAPCLIALGVAVTALGVAIARNKTGRTGCSDLRDIIDICENTTR